MRVFVTGATGFIGSALVVDLIAAGHQVIGLSRSEEKANALAAAGAEVQMGLMDDAAMLTAAAARSDGVVHLAFNHDFTTYMANCEDDRRVIAALGAGLAGTNKPLLITSGTGMTRTEPGKLAYEDGPPMTSAMTPRAASEEAAADVAAKGVNVSVVRLPQVHDTEKQGLITPAVEMFRAKGVCAYVGAGDNRWPAAHVLDVARLYRLALEKAAPGASYHAVAEEGVTMRDICEVVGGRLGLPVKSIAPEEAGEFFGVFGMFANLDSPASGQLTRERLGWTPTGPTMLEDLAQLKVA